MMLVRCSYPPSLSVSRCLNGDLYVHLWGVGCGTVHEVNPTQGMCDRRNYNFSEDSPSILPKYYM